MKLWVVVYNYGLVNESVGVFGSFEDARPGFRECDISITINRATTSPSCLNKGNILSLGTYKEIKNNVSR